IRDKLVTGVQTCALPILITAIANSPGRRLSRSQRWRSPTKTTPLRCRFFIGLLGDPRSPRLRLRRDISRRDALRLSAVKTKRQIFTPRLRKAEVQTHTARMRA